jgi:predicted NACHT family NTPase
LSGAITSLSKTKSRGVLPTICVLYLMPKLTRAKLQRDSEAVLKAIEAQHGLLVERARGIYSFSHLTFQEYFTARYFVESSDSQALENLSSHITGKRWREVFLLTTEMLPNAEG